MGTTVPFKVFIERQVSGMHIKQRVQAIGGILFTGLALPAYVSADQFENRFYLGLGLGISQLEPETKDTGYGIEDKQDLGGKIYFGMDFAKRWSAEVHYADLGAASLENTDINSKGDIEYEVFGLSALYHFYNNHGDEGMLNRSGWDWFLKAGIGSLDNSSDLAFEQNKDTHILLGLGTEYGWANGFAMRIEAETFDEDAQLVTLGMLKRFGTQRSPEYVPAAVPVEQPVAQAEVVDEPVIEVAPEPAVIETPEPIDKDGDGILNEKDLCPETAPETVVDHSGCDAFNGVLEGVHFASGSADLTPQSLKILDQVAGQLLAHPQIRVAVEAHTDNTGPAKANLELSKQRALSVVRYLIGRGVSGQRLQPEAYGESEPATSNANAEGRLANRRVEFRQLENDMEGS